MDRYDTCKKLLDTYLAAEDVVETDEVISFYSLYKMMKEEFAPLYDACHNKDFEKKACQAYMKKNPKYCWRIVGSHRKGCAIRTNLYDSVNHTMNILFHFGDWDTRMISKDYDSDHYYYRKNYAWEPLDKEIVEKCSEDISNTFDVLEDYYHFFEENKVEKNDSLDLSNDHFNLSLSYFDDGSVKYSIAFKEKQYGDNAKEWYDDREPLSDILKRNRKSLLKKLSIPVSELSDLFQVVYHENKEKEKRYSK